jgi:peptidoglycan-associated lipoprotein
VVVEDEIDTSVHSTRTKKDWVQIRRYPRTCCVSAQSDAMFIRQAIVLVTLVSLVLACGRGSPNIVAPRAIAANAPVQVPAYARSEDDATRGNICVSRDVRTACSLADDEAYFAFDLTYLRAQNKRVLRALADCFVSGPLRGHRIDLIGHADPLGPRECNMSLAHRRADNVRQIIVAESKNQDILPLVPKGSVDATGTSEAPWTEDRCVDVRCVDVMLGS